MSTFVFTYRAPKDHRGSAEAADAWSAWFERLGPRLKDRGNPVFEATTLGNCGADTTLGGYSLVRARDLQAAVELARDCPALGYGGGVDIGKVTNRDEQFDDWLDAHSGA
jgi:hypothetical protein